MIYEKIKIQLLSRISKLRLKKKNIIIKKNVVFTNSIFEGNNVINYGCAIVSCTIGYGTYIGEKCKLRNTEVGRFCSIASEVNIIYGSHPKHTFVSTHPAFFSTLKQAGFTYVKENLYNEFKFVNYQKQILVEIGNDVWIGQGVMIMQGVKIGDGAIIGSGAIITKDIEPYSINIGVPSKKIDYRFDEDIIKLLIKTKWWNKDLKWIQENSDKFVNVETFIKDLKEEG